ncbi:MAG TPA: MGMT family protein [Candidatus Paceibacterota bacterium]|nr:MGMT family protein [Candidatus Paceibacterota bacterium]
MMKKLRQGMAPGEFGKRVVRLALSIPPGRVSTYGAIARAAGGGPMASQSITGILGRAWDRGEKGIPFHRIVYADGRVWMSPEYEKARRAKYKKEGIVLDQNGRIGNFRDILFEFK